MFAASKTSRIAAAAAVADPFFDNVTTLLESSGTNGAQNNTFIDSSTNNFTITRNGNTTQGAFSPFGENWSVYFSGSSSAITFPSTSAVAFSTQPYTIEGWVNIPAGSNNKQIFNVSGLLVGTGGFGGSTVGALRVFDGTTTFVTSASYLIATDSWNHFAVVREGTGANQFKLYVNGTLAVVGTSAVNHSAQSGFIGAFNATSDLLTGYISNLRIVKRAVYTTASTTVGTPVFTPSTTPLQTVSDTSLLVCESPSIVDVSGTNLALTPGSGNSVQKFAPFAATTLPAPAYGAFFDGTGDYITAPANAAFQLTGDFTLEAWVYHNAVNSYNNIFGCEDGVNSDWMATRTNRVAIRIANLATIDWTAAFVTGRWYHVAVTRSSNTLRAFVDGVALAPTGSVTNSGQVFQTGAAFSVARTASNTVSNFNGYISNARVVKGQALYTSAFTPSTVPLTTTSQGATASNVSLLTCQSNTFIDTSTNNFAITVFGESRPTAFSPFTLQYASQQPYTPSVLGGSMYFDGTGDSLNTPSSTAFGFGTGDFTMECWVYPTVNARQDWIYLTNGSQLVLLYYNGSNIAFFSNPPNATVITGPAMTLNAWTHVAVSRRSNSTRLFVNGIQAGTTYTTSQDYGATITATIGRDALGSAHATGYISSVRIVKGTGLYISNFVPQNTPLTAVTNTSLLLNATNAGIYDASTINNFETVGNAQVNTSIKRYGLSSIAFDGNGDCLDVKPLLPNFFSQRGAYTIEMWIYPTNLSVAQYFYSQVPTNFLQLAISASGFLQVDRSGVGVAITSSSALTINTWQYVTLVSDGTNLRLYINGVQSGSTVSVGTQVEPSSQIIRIGAYQNSGGAPTFPYYGYIQDFRITRGIARYTTTFTPPTAPLPDF